MLVFYGLYHHIALKVPLLLRSAKGKLRFQRSFWRTHLSGEWKQKWAMGLFYKIEVPN